MNLPYGMADFPTLRREDYFYADKTRFLALLEDPQAGLRHVLFLRPRRFGKSLFLSMLEQYYDVARKDQFAAMFSGLHVGQHPTAERSRYLTLRLDFAGVDAGQELPLLRASFMSQLRTALCEFFARYRGLIPEQAAVWDRVYLGFDGPADLIWEFFNLVRGTPYKLYFLLDEHDNFVNDLVARGRSDVYREVVQATGFVRGFFKRVKSAADAGIIARTFVTGVTPVMINDMSSGFNILTSISRDARFHDLCGFSQADVERLLDGVMATRGLTFDRAQVLGDLRRYYNGYRFSLDGREQIYNPDAVLYFMCHVRAPDQYPEQVLDMNLRTDYSRMHRLFFDDQEVPRPEPIAQIKTLLADGQLHAPLHDLFRLNEAYEPKFFASYLYYLGLLTLAGQEDQEPLLRIPNLVIEQTYGEAVSYIVQSAAEVTVHERELSAAVGDMAFRGQIEAFLSLMFRQVLSKLSNRDLIRMDERALKMLILSYAGMADVFQAFSEMELGRGYGDVILLLDRRYPLAQYSYLLELKYIAETTEGPAGGASGSKPRRRKKAAAQVQREVTAALAEANAQLTRYLSDPRLEGVKGPAGWKAVAVALHGTTALYYQELGDHGQSAPQRVAA